MAVDAYTTNHLISAARNPFHDALNHAYENSIANGLPDIACYPSQGKFLMLQARMVGAKNILELGTLGAYSSIWLSAASPDTRVTTIEVDPKHKKVADENIAYAGVNDRVEVLLGSGLEVMPRLIEEVRSGKREKFDYVFIDADKENNLAYLILALDMVGPRTCICVDNVVRRGAVADPNATDTRVQGARKLIEAVGKDERVDAVVLQTVSEKNYDGFMLAVVK